MFGRSIWSECSRGTGEVGEWLRWSLCGGRECPGCDCVIARMTGSRDVLMREHVGLDGGVEGRRNGSRFGRYGRWRKEVGCRCLHGAVEPRALTRDVWVEPGD